MIEKRTKKNGMLYFVVKASNGHVIVSSEDYYSEAARENAIASLKRIMQGIIFSELKNN